MPIPKTETFRWMGAEGKEIEGLLTFPIGFTAGKRVPLLLVIHGGPAGVFTETYPGAASVYPIAAFAEQLQCKGYDYLRSNAYLLTGWCSQK